MSDSEQQPKPARSLLARLAPVATFVVLAALSLLVWNQQMSSARSELFNHTTDVAVQAGRRLKAFVEFHVRIAAIFAHRWSTHENRDFSRKRFEEFASVVLADTTDYNAIGLISNDRRTVWTVPEAESLGWVVADPAHGAFLDEVARGTTARLSPPFIEPGGATGFLAVLPLRRDDERLGFLVVEIRAERLIDDCFESRIQAEFNFLVADGGKPLFRWSPDRDAAAWESSPVLAAMSFEVHNRTWRLTMAPRSETPGGLAGSAPVLALGLFLSLGFSLLVHQLSRRLELYRSARDRALSEVEERQRAETELKASVEERNRAMERLAALSRKVLMAQEDERERLSRELHDELGQLLTALRLEMGWLQKQISGPGRTDSGVFANTVALAETATDELRRICRGLRPPLLDDLGLEPALRQLVDEFRERSDVRVRLELPAEEIEVPPEVALCTYRILQEALTNVRRHSGAEEVSVTVAAQDSILSLGVADDGTGFDPAELGAMRGFGLEGMRERAALVDGELQIASSSGGGTRIEFRVALSGAEKEDRS